MSQRPERNDEIQPLSTITEPIERNVASVLRAELYRYEQCGRRVGGLGSLVTTYKGETTRGVGTEWREADSPKLQCIVPDPDEASIKSDNASALIELYRQLGTEDGRSKFIEALLRRLSRETEYAPVGYLAAIRAFRLGGSGLDSTGPGTT